MVDYGLVKSTIRPEHRVIDDYSVWENTNIHEIRVVDGIDTEETHTEYEYHQVQYTKNEYILMLIAQETAINGAQDEALIEIYEILGGINL